MPVCDGLSTGPCPDLRNDASVTVGEGDLLLCRKCNAARKLEFIEKLKAEGKLDAEGKLITRASSESTKSRPSQKKSEPVVSEQKLSINELLSYLQFYRDKGNSAGLHRIINNFYTAGEISTAKISLIALFKDKLQNCPFTVERRNSSVRQASDAEVEDILSILEILDGGNLLKNVTFVATNHDRIPRYGPEELNICSVIDKQISTDARLDDVSCQIANLNSRSEQMVSELSSKYTDLDKKLLILIENIHTLSQQKQQHNVTPPSSSTAVNPAVINPPPPTPAIDRSRNVVVFGVDESGSSDEWHKKLYIILHIVLGKDVSNVIEDAFRLGKYTSSKTRPILVKLKSAWDKRLIINNSHCLSKYPEYKMSVFIRSDEAVDVRRKAAMKALFERAQRRGQDPVINDNVLYINNAAVYSLKNGPVTTTASDQPGDNSGDNDNV